LPGDWVDEGKLLLFIREEVATRPPRRGRRLAAEKKRRAEDRARGQKKRRKKTDAESIRGEEEEEEDRESDGGDGGEEGSDLFLMYNTVRGYVSAINELWKIQTSKGLHNSPMPVMVALNALKTSVVRREHHRRREEFVDRGEATIQDGYTVAQIPQVHDKIWSLELGGERFIEQAFRTKVDFLFGNSMLLRSSNRLPMELPDLFSVDLPREGVNGSGWSFVTVMDQGTHAPLASIYTNISQVRRTNTADVSTALPCATRTISPVLSVPSRRTSSGGGTYLESPFLPFIPTEIGTKGRS